MIRSDTLKISSRSLLNKGFIEGHYELVLESTYDSSHAWDTAQVPSVVGALSFQGRATEAEAVQKKYQAKLSDTQQMICEFFIIVGLTRKSAYDQALRRLQKLKPQKGQDLRAFYFYQAHSFFYYFQGRLNECSVHVEKALTASVHAEDLYARSLATDLLGHYQVKKGFIQSGLRHLDEAIKLSKKIGNQGMANAVELAILQYRALYGFDLNNQIELLEKEIQKIQTEDSYSLSLIGLELARQYTLRGIFDQAEETLQKISHQILASGNIRYEIILNLRWSELFYQRGHLVQAMQSVRAAYRCLSLEGTESFTSQVVGMEMKILQSLDPKKQASENLGTLKKLVKSHPSVISHNIFSRNYGGDISHDEDALNILINNLKADFNLHLEHVLKNHLLTLVLNPLEIKRGCNQLYLNFDRNIFLLILNEGIFNLQPRLSKLSFSILLQLASGPQSKDSLCQSVWKYDYHPLRHDPVIYAAINHIRTSLGRAAFVIQNSENGYQLPEDMKIKIVGGTEKNSKKALSKKLST